MIRAVSEKVCSDFDAGVQALPPDLCAPFRAEASRLVDGVKVVGTMAGQLARNEDDLDKVAAIWKTMVEVCDACQKRLLALRESHPLCGAMEFHDEMLDLRNACFRLYDLHA